MLEALHLLRCTLGPSLSPDRLLSGHMLPHSLRELRFDLYGDWMAKEPLLIEAQSNELRLLQLTGSALAALTQVDFIFLALHTEVDVLVLEPEVVGMARDALSMMSRTDVRDASRLMPPYVGRVRPRRGSGAT